jgi:multidrug resistance efflux pump
MPDDPVERDKTVLATLDTAELRLRLARARADQARYLKEAQAAKGQFKEAESQIAQAQADKATAEIDLLEYDIAHAQLRSPISGRVVTGDLKRQIGAPVKTGEVLFEVAPVENLRAELFVPEDQIAEIQQDQEGELATASYPEKRIRFVVERINPVAELVKQRNVFKVRVRLLDAYPWTRPGMEGVAKVDVCPRHYAWIWSRRLVNWVRMELWI